MKIKLVKRKVKKMLDNELTFMGFKLMHVVKEFDLKVSEYGFFRRIFDRRLRREIKNFYRICDIATDLLYQKKYNDLEKCIGDLKEIIYYLTTDL